MTELASKFCPLASFPCRWPTRFIKYPVGVISDLTPIRNDQSTVESPNGTNYSAKGTTHYSTKFGSLQSPNDKLRKLTLSTCCQHVDVNITQYSPLWCVQPSATNTCTMYTNAILGVIPTTLANMMQYRITPPISPQYCIAVLGSTGKTYIGCFSPPTNGDKYISALSIS